MESGNRYYRHLCFVYLCCLAVLTVACEPCENTVLQTSVSPDKSFKVIVFERLCGATTGFNRQCAILPANAKFPKHSKVDSVVWMNAQPAIEVVWTGPREVKIRVEAGYKVEQASSISVPVQLRLEEFSPPRKPFPPG